MPFEDMYNRGSNKPRPNIINLVSTAINTSPSTSLQITVQEFSPVDNAKYRLVISQPFPSNTTGVEPVSVLTPGGINMPLIDQVGDLVLAGSMRGATVKGTMTDDSRYLMSFGANGMPSGVAHFVVEDGLRRLNV